jgi:hypothetical protein
MASSYSRKNNKYVINLRRISEIEKVI